MRGFYDKCFFCMELFNFCIDWHGFLVRWPARGFVVMIFLIDVLMMRTLNYYAPVIIF